MGLNLNKGNNLRVNIDQLATAGIVYCDATPKFLNNYQKEPKTNNSLSFPSKIYIDDKVNKNRTNGGDCIAKMEAKVVKLL
jgi:hypothetical protein